MVLLLAKIQWYQETFTCVSKIDTCESHVRGQEKGGSWFVASNGWISRWRWRHRVSRCTRLVGEAGEVDINTADEEVEIPRSSLSTYVQSQQRF